MQVSSTVESTPAIYISLKSRPSKMNRASRRGNCFRVSRRAFRKTAANPPTTEISSGHFFFLFFFGRRAVCPSAREIIAGNDQFLFYDSCWEKNCRLICSWMKLLSVGTRCPISRLGLYDVRTGLIYSEIIFRGRN